MGPIVIPETLRVFLDGLSKVLDLTGFPPKVWSPNDHQELSSVIKNEQKCIQGHGVVRLCILYLMCTVCENLRDLAVA